MLPRACWAFSWRNYWNIIANWENGADRVSCTRHLQVKRPAEQSVSGAPTPWKTGSDFIGMLLLLCEKRIFSFRAITEIYIFNLKKKKERPTDFTLTHINQWQPKILCVLIQTTGTTFVNCGCCLRPGCLPELLVWRMWADGVACVCSTTDTSWQPSQAEATRTLEGLPRHEVSHSDLHNAPSVFI